MGLFNNLILKARRALQIYKSRMKTEDEKFLPVEVENTIHNVPKIQEKKQELFAYLKETYCDIAEIDPEAALKMIREELETRPAKPVEKALCEIERHIRLTYSGEYFRGVRMKKDEGQ